MCLCACGFRSCQAAFMMCWIFLPSFHCENAHSEAGVLMCSANSPSVSCVSVQSSNSSTRVRRPPTDALSEFVYFSVNHNLNKAFFLHMAFCLIFFFPFMNVIVMFFSHGIIWSGVHLTSCWGCQPVSRQGSDSDLEGTHGYFNWKQLAHQEKRKGRLGARRHWFCYASWCGGEQGWDSHLEASSSP